MLQMSKAESRDQGLLWKVEWEEKRAKKKKRKEQQKEEVAAYDKSQRKSANEAMRRVLFATWEDNSDEEDDMKLPEALDDMKLPETLYHGLLW